MAEDLPEKLLKAADGDVIALFEAAWRGAQADNYRRNSFVANLATAFANVQGPMKELQKGLENRDKHRAERAKRNKKAAAKEKAKA